MRSYLNYGQGLRLDYTRLRSYGDRTAFHVHPHYELYILTHPLKTESIICGKEEHILASAIVQKAKLVNSFQPREKEKITHPCQSLVLVPGAPADRLVGAAV